MMIMMEENEGDKQPQQTSLNEHKKVASTPKPKIMEKFGKNIPSFKFKFHFDIKTLPQKLVHWYREYRRVVLVSKKPDIDELSNISKVTAIGIVIIGFLGFIIQAIVQLLK